MDMLAAWAFTAAAWVACSYGIARAFDMESEAKAVGTILASIAGMLLSIWVPDLWL